MQRSVRLHLRRSQCLRLGCLSLLFCRRRWRSFLVGKVRRIKSAHHNSRALSSVARCVDVHIFVSSFRTHLTVKRCMQIIQTHLPRTHLHPLSPRDQMICFEQNPSLAEVFVPTRNGRSPTAFSNSMEIGALRSSQKRPFKSGCYGNGDELYF